METLTIRRPSNFHDHGRDGDMLKLIVEYIMRYCLYVVFMPNLIPAIRTAQQALRYLERIQQAAAGRFPKCKPLVTIQITEETTIRTIDEAVAQGIMLAKMYIRGVTTNSEDGVRLEKIRDLFPVFRTMAGKMILLIHCEVPPGFGIYCLDQERLFIPYLRKIRKAVPSLKIVVEHMTSKEMGKYVIDQDPTLTGATITGPHLQLTLNDIIGGKLKGHNFCRPPAKTHPDRDYIRALATNADRYPNIFYGSDSAAHPWWGKETPDCCAGIFSDPCGIETVTEVFEMAGKLTNTERFLSLNGPRFYGLPEPEMNDIITLIREPWKVLDSIDEPYAQMLYAEMGGGSRRPIPLKVALDRTNIMNPVYALSVIPFRAGEMIGWRVKD